MKKYIILITLLSTSICSAKLELSDSQFLDYENNIENENVVQSVSGLVGSGFNYQGELIDAGSPSNGNHDFSFRLFDAPAGGSQVGANEIKGNRPVVNGLFSIEDIDFGDAAYTGDELWLSVTVRETGNPGSETTLSPRQKIHAVPYAVQAEFSSSPWIENGSNVSYDGTVGIGGTIIANVDLFIDSDTGRSPFIARVNNDPKFQINANGGTTIGFLLELPPEDGLLVEREARIGANSSASVSSSNGILSVGNTATDHITFDGDDIQARNGSSNNPDALFLNFYGGDVRIGNSSSQVFMRGDVSMISNEINASASGSADMKAYVYGRASSTGAIVTAQSSSGFTVSRTSTGRYRVEINDTTINSNYIVVATTNSSLPKFTTVVIGNDGFDLRVWTSGGVLSDHSFQFVVYRK